MHPLRTTVLTCAGTLVVAAGLLSVAKYETGRGIDVLWRYSPAWAWLGPGGSALEEATLERLRDAIDSLNDRSGRSAMRSSAYAAEMHAAKSFLQRALIANPLDSRSIARLAAVSWELDVLDNTMDRPKTLRLIALAQARAPRVAKVHLELGSLLYRFGEREQASRMLAHALSLDSRHGWYAVHLMRDFGESPARIADTLPRVPEVVLALRDAYSTVDHLEEYSRLLDRVLDDFPVEILPTYAEVELQADRPHELLVRLSAPFHSEPSLAEPLRLIQRARALVRLNDLDGAQTEANRARMLAPTEPAILEAAATVALECGHSVEAVRDFRAALSAVAGRREPSAVRGRLYRQIGRAEELADRLDLAFDAYRRALDLDPTDAFARSEIARIERAAGYPTPAGGAP